MSSTYRYLPIYMDLVYRDFPMDSTYRCGYPKLRISARIINLVYYAHYAAVTSMCSGTSLVAQRTRASIMLVDEMKAVSTSRIEIRRIT
jgi:hypothetical protein